MNPALNLSPSSPDDRRLVELHLAGDGGAFRQIVERYQGMICALAVSACGDLGRSEDIAQEVFIAAWKQLPELREPEKLRGWLAGIARNLINNSFRQQQRTPTARAEPLSAGTPTDIEGPREHAISADEAALMWNTLERIPENYREPMVLFYREQRSVPAVAAALEISEDAVRQRLVRGRAMLSERMAKLVEQTLERSGPGQALTQAVMAALPVGLTAAKGSAAGKTALTAGAVGAALGKGSVGVKLIATAGALPALMSGLAGSLDFRARHDAAKTPEARRLITRAHVAFHVGIALGMVGVALWVWAFHERVQGHLGIYVIGLIVISSLPALIAGFWSRRQFHRLTVTDPAGPHAAEGVRDMWQGPGFEYRSERCLLGLPLVHVRVGRNGRFRSTPVKAWVAWGDVALGVLVAGGGIAVAPVSTGGITLGLLSFGGIAVGGFAIGGMAAGALAAGGMAAGLMAVGGMVFAPFANERFDHLADSLLWVSMVAWGFAWLPPLLFIGWHRWRRRATRPE
jgi:RNA polymerase sigma factor (sigma-70 family)